MGYYSYHELDVYSLDYRELELVHDALELRKDDYYGLSLYDSYRANIKPAEDGYVLHVDGSDTVKWYDSHEHMLELSRKFPYCRFEFTVDGEESGDYRRTFYVNGRHYEVEATFPEFEIERLM